MSYNRITSDTYIKQLLDAYIIRPQNDPDFRQFVLEYLNLIDVIASVESYTSMIEEEKEELAQKFKNTMAELITANKTIADLQAQLVQASSPTLGGGSHQATFVGDFQGFEKPSLDGLQSGNSVQGLSSGTVDQAGISTAGAQNAIGSPIWNLQQDDGAIVSDGKGG